MLSAAVDEIEQLKNKFPLYASPKLDGVRALIVDGKVVSRNLKPIPNRAVQRELPVNRIDYWDGELIVGNPWDKDCFRNTTSGVMSEDGYPSFTFWVFDSLRAPKLEFNDRFIGLKANVKSLCHERVRLVPQVLVRNLFELQTYEQQMLDKGFEGVMLRDPRGLYKFGRSTLNEKYLIKLKRFKDSEARVLYVQEQMHNANEGKRNALGQLERSSHKENKIGKKTMGALRVVDIHTDVEFDIGTGFDDGFRKLVWKSPKMLIGKVVKYKYFPTGSKDKPRFPVFLGLRNPIDL